MAGWNQDIEAKRLVFLHRAAEQVSFWPADMKLNGPSLILQIERYRQQQYGGKKYNFCIIVLRGTLKSGTRNKIIIKNFNGRHAAR